jgi:hypothetical protein
MPRRFLWAALIFAGALILLSMSYFVDLPPEAAPGGVLGAAVEATPAATSPSTPGATPPAAHLSTPGATPAASPVAVDPATLEQASVNELGVIPVLMYHTITTDHSIQGDWVRQVDDFRSDLQWLYDHDFYVIPVRSLIDNAIDVPLGKHPVILTFDDSSAGQFQFMKNDQGELVPTPDSAVGVLEAFFAEHPDFGKSGHFAIVPEYCFADKSREFNGWKESCAKKLQWLSDHGYEVGNHTWSHQNLYLIDSEQVAAEVGRAAQFIDERVTGPGNLSRVLTLPFGEAPAPGTDGASYLANGVWWEGEEWVIEAMFRVSGGPMYSPSSSWWDPTSITRFNTDQGSLDMWFGTFESGDYALYTSDGNPGTVTIPDPLPVFLQNELDPGLIAASGKSLLEYTPAAAMPLSDLPSLAPNVVAYTNNEGVRLRSDPSTNGEILSELGDRQAVTIVSGPIDADGYRWWEVVLEDGTQGWLAEDFLDGPPAS